MSWNYSGDPSTSELDAVRYYSGQTDKHEQLVSNEEILFEIDQEPNLKLAAANVLDHLARKFSKDTDERVGDVQRSGSKLAEAFRKRADELREEVEDDSGGGDFFFGGLSKSGNQNLESDSDARQPVFRIGDDDHPGIQKTPPNRKDYWGVG